MKFGLGFKVVELSLCFPQPIFDFLESMHVLDLFCTTPLQKSHKFFHVNLHNTLVRRDNIFEANDVSLHEYHMAVFATISKCSYSYVVPTL